MQQQILNGEQFQPRHLCGTLRPHSRQFRQWSGEESRGRWRHRRLYRTNARALEAEGGALPCERDRAMLDRNCSDYAIAELFCAG
jgi:hypothetical protein